jgi:lipopolysaccharide assembly protein A
MTEPAAPHGTTSTLPPPAANGAGPSTPPLQAAERSQPYAPTSGMRTAFIAGLAALTVMVIFIIQNVHAADISFLGVHLVLPLAGALLLAAIAGALLTVAAGPARVAQLRQAIQRSLRKARAGLTAPDDRVLPGPSRPVGKTSANPHA